MRHKMTFFLLLIALSTPVWADNPKVSLETSEGTITLELYPDKAPQTVNNFLAYVGAGFYEGTLFHRVIDGFMIQGGGFTQDMQRKPTRDPIQNEANNGLKNERGTVAMARTSVPHSATSQFFINLKDNAFLDFKAQNRRGWGYCVFGKVTEGMEVVDKIAKQPTGAQGGMKDVPETPIVIERAVRIDAE